MTELKTAGYGSWKSPITSDLIASGAVRLDVQIELEGDDVYWVETRPTEEGRYVIVHRLRDRQAADVTPKPYNVRTRIHEYGGGAFIIDNGTVYFSNFVDQRLYRQDTGAKPHPITPEGDVRYANGVIDYRRGRIICVCEDHTVDDNEPANSLVGISLDGTGHVQQLVSGNDFYSSPRVRPDGSHLAWLTWNHPNMPWDSTELWVGEITENGSIRYSAIHIRSLSEQAYSCPRKDREGSGKYYVVVNNLILIMTSIGTLTAYVRRSLCFSMAITKVLCCSLNAFTQFQAAHLRTLESYSVQGLAILSVTFTAQASSALVQS